MKNVLIISGHPDLSKSVANAAILAELAKLSGVQIRNLGELYKDYKIDVPAEQEALLWADIIVWQFPFYWYSLPAIMKKWLDEVFTHGFAHGSAARLGGKELVVSFSTGAPEAVYKKDGFLGHDMNEYLVQFESTAKLCNLNLRFIKILNGVSYVGRDEAAAKSQAQMAKAYAAELIALIESLRG
ncbi:NAD(P)H-dependent oxidoreductase [Campylobacter sp. 19-13652]|uniref:NAD(P)H-dependent oxidoreductase n=1 Tax=Campylobacter sp. 19-13652 TaxID=2840180 RepID=UPI001C790B21|nr:NAD(P)H-dependent oxidoreductase [Campylobacter sp. 19-13652]BCX80179.1 NAD(P)H dehydrogenase [Campylobacter sp. 19-13652]